MDAWIDDSICAKVSDGYVFPNQYDCTSYYQCVHKKVLLRYCQTGLYFNPANNFCDWPRNVNCNPLTTQPPTKTNPTTQSPTTKAPTTQSPTTNVPTTKAPTTNAPTTRAPTTNAPTTKAPTTRAPSTNAPTTTKPSDTCPYDGAVRDPSDCSRYYLCWGGTKLQSHGTKQCPSGQMFSSVYKVCDNADRVNCGDNPSTEAPTTKVPTTKLATTTQVPTTKLAPTTRVTTGAPSTAAPTSAPENPCINNDGRLLPHPSDCTQYIQCLFGSPLARPCNAGLYFSVTHRTCTWPSMAGCQ